MKVDSRKTSLIELFTGKKPWTMAKYFSKSLYEDSLFKKKSKIEKWGFKTVFIAGKLVRVILLD